MSRPFPAQARFGGDASRVFASPAALGDTLTEVLRAYVIHRPDVGYVQGMSYLAAVLILVLRDPFPSFVALANLLQAPFFFDFYKLDAGDVRARLAVFDRLFEATNPRLRAHFLDLGLDSDAFVLDWALTLFATCGLETRVLHHVWECFFLDGAPFFVRCALAILDVLEVRLLAADDVGALLAALRGLPASIDDATLFAALSNVRVSPATYADLLDESRRKPPAPPGASAPAPHPPCYFPCAPM